jgi:hypothetical protein|nr:MAG TPA_asm: hypothetical protein [Caudoviricetes sp.]
MLKQKNKQKGDIKMKAYKGFDRDLKCRGFQYEIGKEYEEKEAEACENPLEVFRYYPPCDGNRYCEVEQDGELSKHDGDSKVASTKIKIGVELGLKGLIQAGVSFILDKVNWKADAATNTGAQSAAVNLGYRSAATNTGDLSAAMNTGDRSAAVNTGDYSAAVNSGIQSAAVNSGTGSAAETSNGDSVAIVTGYNSKAKAGLGSAIVIAERGVWNGKTYPLINIKAAIVDGEKIKADTWYTLINGEFVECD